MYSFLWMHELLCDLNKGTYNIKLKESRCENIEPNKTNQVYPILFYIYVFILGYYIQQRRNDCNANYYTSLLKDEYSVKEFNILEQTVLKVKRFIFIHVTYNLLYIFLI